MHNITGIIGEPQNLQLPDIVEFTLFSFRIRTFVTILAYTSVDVPSDRPASWSVDSTTYFEQKNLYAGFVFRSSWSLASIKSMWFKTFMSESIVWFKRPDNQSRNLNWKVLSVRDQKLSGNFNSPSGYQYRIFTCIFVAL